MDELRQLFKPAYQNSVQRKGFASALIAIVILVFLHNPLDGYRTTETETFFVDILQPRCTEADASEAQRLHIQSTWPIEKWDTWREGYLDPLPEGIASWPLIKQLEWRNTFSRRAQEIRSRCIQIQSRSREEPLPVTEWTSNAPLIPWLGSVLHLFGAALAIGVAAFIWLLVFSNAPKGSSDS